MVKNPREKTSLGPIHPLNKPAPADVQEDERYRPVSVTRRRRRLEVTSIEDVWEIVDEWWRANPIARRYYNVTLGDGTGLTIFRDLLSGVWYEQRA